MGIEESRFYLRKWHGSWALTNRVCAKEKMVAEVMADLEDDMLACVILHEVWCTFPLNKPFSKFNISYSWLHKLCSFLYRCSWQLYFYHRGNALIPFSLITTIGKLRMSCRYICPKFLLLRPLSNSWLRDWLDYKLNNRRNSRCPSK